MPEISFVPIAQINQYEIKVNGKERSKLSMRDFWIEQGWYRTDDGKSLTLLRADWSQKRVRAYAIQHLFEKVLKKDPRLAEKPDFYENGLGKMLMDYYRNSPYLAVKEAWPGIARSELKHAKKKRLAKSDAYSSLLKIGERNDKPITSLSRRELGKNSWFFRQYGGSRHEMLTNVTGLKLEPWQLHPITPGFFNERKNRVAAVKSLCEILRKEPIALTQSDYKENKMLGLLSNHYDSSTLKAAREVNPERNYTVYDLPHSSPSMQKALKNLRLFRKSLEG